MQQELQLTLTVPEINQILELLGQQPYIEVHALISKIQQQAQAQLQSNNSQTSRSDVS